MSTLDAQGMVAGYKVNRSLNEYEKEHRFSVKQPCSAQPHYELSLTKLNSSFVECVDKWYAMRGSVALVSGVVSMFFSCLLYVSLSNVVEHWHPAAVPIILFTTALLALSIYLFTRDAFTYTHYPIRFNRKNRQVYVFRRDGTVLKTPWDTLCWTIYGHGVGTRDLFVVGHVMAEDKQTIAETFGLSVTTAGRPGEEKLRDHFEFFRRYMEEGPGYVLEAIKPVPLIMLPGIQKERESFAFGWERLTLHENGSIVGMVLYQVFVIPMSLFRWIAMQTSKIPQWPQWVEDECAIEPNDPWVRDERHRA